MPDDQRAMIDFNEAIELIMQRTGRSRRQARAVLIEACRQGKVPASGIHPRTGKREVIPPECFPKIH
jgi:hypothetical protein